MALSPNTTVALTLIELVERVWDVAVIVIVCPGGGTRGAVYPPAREILPMSPPSMLALATVQLTRTVAPPAAVAVQSRVSPEATIKGDGGVVVPGGRQVTAAIETAGSMVMVVVPFVVLSALESAVIVTTLLLFAGRVEGAVYKPLVLSIDPKLPVPVPLTDQVTRVLLKFKTVAVH
jgi:hypothetical protein